MSSHPYQAKRTLYLMSNIRIDVANANENGDRFALSSQNLKPKARTVLFQPYIQFLFDLIRFRKTPAGLVDLSAVLRFLQPLPANKSMNAVTSGKKE